jgi:hypothetical protein
MRNSSVLLCLTLCCASLAFGQGDGAGSHRILYVFDANGHRIGPLVTSGGTAGVTIHAQGAMFLATISSADGSRYAWT